MRASSTTRSAASSIVRAASTLGSAAAASSARPSSPLVPSSRTTNGTCGRICSNASISPRATSSPRVMPPKMLNSTAVTFGSERITSTAAVIASAFDAAAGVEEVRRRAAVLRDDVERRHHEAGAVAEDADVAVELDVGQVALLRHPLLRVLAREVAQRGVLGMAVERVVVERHLRVERDERALRRDDQRVDLDEHRLLRDERGVEALEERADRAHEVLVDAGLEREPAAVEGLEAEQRVDVQRRDRLRASPPRPARCPCRRASRASPAAPSRCGRRRTTRRLGRDLRRALDPQLVHGQAADVHAEDRRRVLARLRRVGGDLDAAELAAAADLDLRLDRAGEADRVGGRHRLVDAARGLARREPGSRDARRAAFPGIRGDPSARRGLYSTFILRGSPHPVSEGSRLMPLPSQDDVRHLRRLRNPDRLGDRHLGRLRRRGRSATASRSSAPR